MDYPAVSEVMVSFPDQWELVRPMERGDTLLYLAAMPPNQEWTRRDRFYGLAPEVNLELNTYQLYKFFQPMPIPSVIVSWDEATGTGRVEKMGDLKMQLRPIGQAQIWRGPTYGVLWECYFHETRRRATTWQDELCQFWRAVEEDMGVVEIFTQPHEPTFERGYTNFLSRLGYAPDPVCPEWWSKQSAPNIGEQYWSPM